MIESMIYKHLIDQDLPGIGYYDHEPAVFNQRAPDDTDRGWNGLQFGRVVYDLLMKDDAERKVSGSLNIMTAYVFDEEGYKNMLHSEKQIKSAFDGTFFSDDDLTIASVWRKTQPFKERMDNEEDTEVCGLILEFDVYAFPALQYKPMDPVNSLAAYIGQNWQNIKVINLGQMSEIWMPDDDTTAVYVRLETNSLGTFPSTYACTWFMSNLKVHVISNSDNLTNEFVMSIMTSLSERERFPMDDGSPFFVQKIQFGKKLDALRDGQLTVNGQYGVLREINEKNLLNNVKVERRK